jgi:hypothetical protein
MEKVKELNLTLRIETNKRTVEKYFESLFDLKSFMDDFFCSLRDQKAGRQPTKSSAQKSGKRAPAEPPPKRFGVVALEKGFITLDQLADAQHSQLVDNVERGKHRPIGGILSKMGLLTMSQIAEILRSQREIQSDAPA